MKIRYVRLIPKRLRMPILQAATRFHRWRVGHGKWYRCVACREEGNYRWYKKHVGNCDVAKTRKGRRREERWEKKRAKSNGHLARKSLRDGAQ